MKPRVNTIFYLRAWGNTIENERNRFMVIAYWKLNPNRRCFGNAIFNTSSRGTETHNVMLLVCMHNSATQHKHNHTIQNTKQQGDHSTRVQDISSMNVQRDLCTLMLSCTSCQHCHVITDCYLLLLRHHYHYCLRCSCLIMRATVSSSCVSSSEPSINRLSTSASFSHMIACASPNKTKPQRRDCK
jgi:hypothetical protein